MAVFIPTIEQIKQFKVKPEVGELALLSFLEKNLDDSYEVYFNPYMNGDRPDIIIMRRRYGVMIIEVMIGTWIIIIWMKENIGF